MRDPTAAGDSTASDGTTSAFTDARDWDANCSTVAQSRRKRLVRVLVHIAIGTLITGYVLCFLVSSFLASASCCDPGQCHG